ncbi:MAG: four helix bundle protein [Rikenellaceae bacterium]
MKENVIKSKSFLFAIRIVNVYKHLRKVKKEFIMSKQLLRCGTSVGAMVRESEHAESKVDFIHKLAIAQKEINESLYWIELLYQTDYISDSEFKSIFNDADELMCLLTSIIKSAKKSLE